MAAQAQDRRTDAEGDRRCVAAAGNRRAILAVREVIRGGTIPPATPVSRLSDIELGWLFAASLFAWIKARAEQATAEGWDIEDDATADQPRPAAVGRRRGRAHPAGARSAAGHRLEQADQRLAEGHDGPVPARGAAADQQRR